MPDFVKTSEIQVRYRLVRFSKTK